jgi:hypothetical protein
MVLRARLMLIEGHEHSALDLLRKAEKVRPKDGAIKLLLQQALGKLGRAELLLEGKGAIIIDGHRFASPRKIKVPAGPHLVDIGDGENEITVKRNEKKKLKVKR